MENVNYVYEWDDDTHQKANDPGEYTVDAKVKVTENDFGVFVIYNFSNVKKKDKATTAKKSTK